MRARKAGIPVLYVNGNYGDWRSEKEALMGRLSRIGFKSGEAEGFGLRLAMNL
jgi:hypothetical protein